MNNVSWCNSRRGGPSNGGLWALGAILYFAIVLVIAFSLPLPQPPSPSVEINGKPGLQRPAKNFRF